MNKVFVILSLVIGAVLVFAFLPVINDTIENVEYETITETHTAVEDNLTPEVVTLTYTPYSVESVMVDEVALTLTTDYTFADGVLTINADVTSATDEITVEYVYVDETMTSQTAVLGILPLLIVVVVVVYFVRKV